MNIAVINAKDLLKYILKFFFMLTIIVILIKGIKSLTQIKKEITINQAIETNTKKINNYTFLKCLDLNISLLSYKKTKESSENIFTSNKILALETGFFNKSIYENTDLVINEEELTIDDADELVNQIAQLPDNVTVESVEENNIVPKVTSSYGNVQINNQSDYEITEDMLIPDVEISNKKDILIYHTHTCESYTASSRI